MGRIRQLERGEIGAESQAVYDWFVADRGVVPNSFRTFAHAEPLLSTLVGHYRALIRDAELPAPLKQMVLLRVSALNACHY